MGAKPGEHRRVTRETNGFIQVDDGLVKHSISFPRDQFEKIKRLSMDENISFSAAVSRLCGDALNQK